MADAQNSGTQASNAQQPQQQPVQDAEYWRQQAIAQNQQREALQQQYNADMSRVYDVLSQQQAAQQAAQQPQAAPEPAWDASDPAQLKKNVEESLQTTLRSTLAPVFSGIINNQYESHMMNARRDEQMPYFAYWEQEIRQLAAAAGQTNPGVLADYNTIRHLYALIAAKHGPELVEREVRRRIAEQQAQPDDEVEVDEDQQAGAGPTPTAPQASQPPPPQQPQYVQQQARPSPPQPTTVQPSRSVRTGSSSRRLSREEAHVAERMGVSLRDYASGKDLGDIDL